MHVLSDFEHSGDISCSILVNPSHTDESWGGRNMFMCIYIYIHKRDVYIYIYHKPNICNIITLDKLTKNMKPCK